MRSKLFQKIEFAPQQQQDMKVPGTETQAQSSPEAEAKLPVSDTENKKQHSKRPKQAAKSTINTSHSEKKNYTCSISKG